MIQLQLVELVRRIRTLTLTLLPVEVPLESINDPTSRIITPQVIIAYMAAAGDLLEAVSHLKVASSIGYLSVLCDFQLPYCLLRARKEFMWDANHNPADYGENLGRGVLGHEKSGYSQILGKLLQLLLVKSSLAEWSTSLLLTESLS